MVRLCPTFIELRARLCWGAWGEEEKRERSTSANRPFPPSFLKQVPPPKNLLHLFKPPCPLLLAALGPPGSRSEQRKAAQGHGGWAGGCGASPSLQAELRAWMVFIKPGVGWGRECSRLSVMYHQKFYHPYTQWRSGKPQKWSGPGTSLLWEIPFWEVHTQLQSIATPHHQLLAEGKAFRILQYPGRGYRWQNARGHFPSLCGPSCSQIHTCSCDLVWSKKYLLSDSTYFSYRAVYRQTTSNH